MATMICERSEIANVGERMFFDACRQYLNDSYVVYYNREIQGLEFDYLLLIPRVGLCVVEVKGWNEQTVDSVLPTGQIQIEVNNGEIKKENPREQVRSYRYVLQNRIKSLTGSHPLLFHMICYPNLSEAFMMEKGFQANCDLFLTFSKDDLNSKERFEKKLNTAIYAFRDWNVDTFDQTLYGRVRRMFEPNFEPQTQKDIPLTVLENNTLIVPYSLVLSIPIQENRWQELIDKAIAYYANGCKVYAAFSTFEMQEYCAKRLEDVYALKRLGTMVTIYLWGKQTPLHPKILSCCFIGAVMSISNKTRRRWPVPCGLRTDAAQTRIWIIWVRWIALV